MGTAASELKYTAAEFTNAPQPNAAIFQAELAELALSIQPFQVSKQGTDMRAVFADIILAADVSLINQAVIDHLGGVTSADPVIVQDQSESTDDSGTPQTKLTLTTGLLEAGTYVASWYAEVKVDAETANSGVRAALLVNGTERGETNWDLPAWHNFSGSFPIERNSGQTLNLELQYDRLGPTSNPVTIRRARLGVRRVDT